MKNYKKQFGGKIDKTFEKEYAKSTNWKNGKFQNLEETKLSISIGQIPGLLFKQLFVKNGKTPVQSIDISPYNVAKFSANGKNSKFIWYGHSSLLMNLNSKIVFIDPMLGADASPIAPFKTKRFSNNLLHIINDLPKIDLILISHDHYDHLDYDSIQLLKDKTKHFFVALGIKRHLVNWGIDEDKIKEFDWWDEAWFTDIKITFTPSRHFSGRGITDRDKSLWGSWALKTDEENIFFSGDGGYGQHFKKIGKQLGPFNLAFMECGQYNELWHPIHMFPEESVKATIDVNAKKVVPIHWAGFALAQHSWTEPVKRIQTEAKKRNVQIFTPKIGQIFYVNDVEEKFTKWWENH